MRARALSILPALLAAFPLACGSVDVPPSGTDASLLAGADASALTPEDTLEACQDGIDNDGDGFTDCEDVMFAGSSCPWRPSLGTPLPQVIGFETWFTSSTQALTQLAPRSPSDIVH